MSCGWDVYGMGYYHKSNQFSGHWVPGSSWSHAIMRCWISASGRLNRFPITMQFNAIHAINLMFYSSFLTLPFPAFFVRDYLWCSAALLPFPLGTSPPLQRYLATFLTTRHILLKELKLPYRLNPVLAKTQDNQLPTSTSFILSCILWFPSLPSPLPPNPPSIEPSDFEATFPPSVRAYLLHDWYTHQPSEP